MKWSLACLLLSCSFILKAQDSFYDYLELGDNKIGYYDTLIYSKVINYNQFQYSGPAPIFIKVWYPSQAGNNSSFLKFGDLYNSPYPDTLTELCHQHNIRIDSSFIRSYFQTYEVNDTMDIAYKDVDFGDYSNHEVLEAIKNVETRSIRGQPQLNLQYPVVVYHHGAQSFASESYFLAEFLASNGYIVISAHYQLPYENKIYGYDPPDFDDTVLPKAVISFARSITSCNNIYFIGHSAGAQVGFRFLYEPGWCQGFISLETSTEFWTKKSIKRGWNRLYKAIMAHKDDYQLPIMMVANTSDWINPFPLYEEISTAPMWHVSSKVYFDHESYTSVYHMRYFLRDQVEQKDTENSKGQLLLYIEHIKLIEAFLSSLESETYIDVTEYADNFFFTTFNLEK